MFHLSQALTSLPISLLHKMATVMKEASEVDPERVQVYETRRHIVWRTFSYCVECLYEPPYGVTTDKEDLMMTKLWVHANECNTSKLHLLISLSMFHARFLTLTLDFTRQLFSVAIPSLFTCKNYSFLWPKHQLETIHLPVTDSSIVVYKDLHCIHVWCAKYTVGS